MFEPSSQPGRWTTFSGAALALLGAALLILPIGGGEGGLATTGFALLAAALVELACGVKASRAPVRRVELLMSM